MTSPRTLDYSHLPPCDVSSKTPLYLGQLLLCLIEGSMFCMLIAMYLYLRLRVDVWPPPGVKLPGVVLPTIALVPLLASGIASYWASEAAKKDDRRAMLWGLSLNIALATIFLAMRAIEWHSLNFTWSSDVHGSIVWAILFLHTYDIVSDQLATIVLLVIIARGGYHERHRLGVHVDGGLWYFLMASWLPLYFLIYWGPRILGTP